MLVDVDGYLTNGFTPTGPSRAVDTRALSQKVTDVVLSPVGLAGASGFALTLTVTEPTAAGFATVYPCGQQPPVVSNINFVDPPRHRRQRLLQLKAPGNRSYLRTFLHL